MHSYKLLVIIILIMKKTRSAIYFEKRYCLLVHSLILNQRMTIAGFSQNSCEKEVTDRTCSYNLNQIVYVNCIDVIRDGVTTSDSEAILHFSLTGDKLNKKNGVAVVRFDMNHEKIVKPQSTVLFSKELNEGRGILHYKFINLKTKTLTYEQFELNRQRKNELQLQTSKDEHAYKLQELSRLIEQKDDLIQKLEKKIETLILQNRKIKDQAHQSREHSKEKTINFNVKVNPFNENLRKENERLMAKLKQMQQFNEELQNQISEYVKKEETYERQHNLLRKQLQKFEKTHQSQSRTKSRGRTVSYVQQQSFLRNSNAAIDPYQSNADWVQSQQNPTRITINEPSRRESYVQLRQQESEIALKSNNSQPPQNSQSKLLQAQSSMYASNYVPVTSEKGPKESQTSQKQKVNESQNLDNSIDKHGEAALNRRISMQKDDLKWTSIIYERNQQIQILKRKLQQKANQLKVAEKEIQKLKVAAKKKDTQVKEMQKQMQKKIIFGNGSSGQLKKNRADLQLQFQKIQAKHDEEKLRLQGQIDQISKQKDMQDKQTKKLKTQLTECQERSKTIEVKYNELKKFTQKKEEQFIQYREKSSQYDVMSIKFKELEGALKTTTGKYEILQKQSKKEKDAHTALKIRFAQLQRQWQRLRSAERVFQTSKNQAIILSKSVQSYEHRYNELKKYCIKAQASFNKYKNSKRKNESEQIKQDKEMQQRFIQLAKKMEETQLHYYKQQIQDYNEEKVFITTYFEKMLRQERDKIFEDKEISQEHKKSIIIQKQKEIERNLQRRLEEIKQKVSKIERSHDELVNKMKESKQSGFNKPLPQQIRLLEKRITTIQQKQAQRANQRRNLKETITQVNEQLKRASSSAQLQLQSQQLALNKNFSTANAKGQLMMSIYNDKSQQRSMVYIDEARQKSEASHQRLYEQNRKMNTQLVKENGQLKMKNQKLTIDIQKVENKAQSRVKQLEQAFKKSEIDFKLKNDKLTEQLQKKDVEIENLKRQCSDNIQAIASISKEATKLSQELQTKIEEIHQLEQKIIQLQQRIQQYEQGQRIMIQQVNQVKKEAQINQNQLFELIEQRSNNFARIQKIKQTQIDKWKAAVHELQIKLEGQMFENIQAKDKFEALKANYEKLEKETQQKIESLKIDIENKEEQCNQIYIKEFQTTRQNETLQQNLMEISTQIQNKELQLVQLTFELTKKTKELDVYKRQSQRFEELQCQYKDEIKGLQLLLDDKIQQIRAFQDKYKHFQIEMEYNAKDMQKLALSNLKYETQAKEYQQKYMAKHQEIINVKNECSMVTIKLQMQEMTLKNLQNQNEHLRRDIEDLNRQIQRLNEAASHQTLRVSRKVSNSEADSKFDCPSPGRSRKMPKKTGTLEVPETSMIGMTNAGGITPILPPTPNPLARKMSENPFEPKQQSRKSKVLRGTSMQQEKEEDQMIAIHIQSPPTSKMPSKSESNVHIDIEEMQESIRLTNANTGFGSIKRPSRKNEQQSQIREQTQQNQDNSGGFGRNIELQDSQYLHDDGEYQEKIRQLERQLIYSNDENQKLNVQIIELTKKVDQLTQQVSQLPIRSPSLGVSRRRSILQIPPKQNTERESSEGKIERNPFQSHTLPPEGSIRRSNSGLELNGSHQGGKMTVKGNVGQLQQQYEAAQLQIQYLTNELNGIKAELQQSNKNNERLIEQAQLCRETIEDLNNKLEEAHFQIEQTKNFIQFQELYQQQKETSNHLRVQIEELNAQLFAKQSHIGTLMNQNCQAMDQANEVRAECATTQESKAKLQQKVKQLTQTIQKLKVQYRKYEQSAQLEIVKLHETIDTLKTKIHEKQDEFVVLGEELINIQNEKQDLATYIEQYGKNSKMKEYHQNQMESRCNQLQAELDKNDENRQNLYKTIKKLQLELLERDDKEKSSSNQLALMMKKYEIKLQSNQEEIQILQSKIAQKQKIITALKNQIGLYNEQCLQLKNLNDELNHQSTKVEKQLKDIMMTYSAQIQSYKEIIDFKEKQVHNLTNIIKEKQNEYHNLSKNMRMAEKEKEGIQYDYIDTKNALQKLKNAKNKECNDLYMQIQYKNSQCQKLKTMIQTNKRDLQSKEQFVQQETQKYENRLKAYKEKLEKYEGLIEQFQIQLKKVEQRPTTEIYEEVIFENQILKNRVDELQQQLHSKGSMKEKEEQVYMQFRKYKANKDRQIQDLNSQMEKYSFKINQLEESMFFLKRQNDALKKQNITLSESKEEMSLELEDLKQSLQEVEKELQFYKKRKLLDMQKLLNETQ